MADEARGARARARIATLRAETGRADRAPWTACATTRLHREARPRGSGPGQPGETVLKLPPPASAREGADARAWTSSRSCFFLIALVVNGRAVFKLRSTGRACSPRAASSRDAYARASTTLPDRGARSSASRPRRSSCTWCPPTRSPTSRRRSGALLASRYPHGQLHVVVATRRRRSARPHPAMGEHRRAGAALPRGAAALSAEAALARGDARARAQGAPAQLGAPPRGAARDPRPRSHDPRRRVRGRERRRLDARSRHLPLDRPARARGHGAPRLPGHPALARQLRPARRSAGASAPIQQSSIFIRVSIARLHQRGQARAARSPRLAARGAARWPRCCGPAFELCFRRSQICLGHNQFVRLDALQALGGFPTSGATEDSTLGYALGAPRRPHRRPLPMLELTDLPETTESVIRQNARWYQGVLDDVRVPARASGGRSPPPSTSPSSPGTSATRSSSGPIAALVYPVTGWLGWYLAYRFTEPPVLVLAGDRRAHALARPHGVGGRHRDPGPDRGASTPYLPRPVTRAARA